MPRQCLTEKGGINTNAKNKGKGKAARKAKKKEWYKSDNTNKSNVVTFIKFSYKADRVYDN